MAADLSSKVKAQMETLGLGGAGGIKSGRPAADGAAPRDAPKGRVAVAAESSSACDKVAVGSYKKAPEVKRLIEKAISGNILFEGLPQAALDSIIDSMQPRSVGPGKDIIKQGDTAANEFYVLESGAADALLQRPGDAAARRVATYGPGGSFGELALLYSAPRAATVRSTAPCALWVAERAVVMRIKRQFAERQAQAKLDLIERVPMFGCLTDGHKQLLAGALEQSTYTSGQTVLSEKERGELFFIIKEGSVALRSADGAPVLTSGDGSAPSRLGPGEFFGEAALLPKTGALTAAVAGGRGRGGNVAGTEFFADSPRVVCLVMRRAEFERLLGPYEELWRYEVLRRVPILFALSDRQLWQLARLLQPVSFLKGAAVFRSGDPADAFYIVQSGAFTCFTNEGKELARVGPGQCFGELALLNDDNRAANVVALEDAEALSLKRDAFHQLLGRLDTLRHMWRFEALRRVPLLRGLPDKQRAELAAALKQLTVPRGSAVVTQGEEGNAFYIVESGQLAAYKDGGPAPVLAYGPGDYFGELALIRADSRRNATVRARTEATLLALERADFHRLLGPLVPQLQAAAQNYRGYVASATKAGREIQLSDLQQLTILGAGGFGRVTLVKHKNPATATVAQQFFALKQMSKPYIKAQGLVRHVHREKAAMLEVDSPWLVGLEATMRDEKNIYMLLEAVLGGELFAYLQTRRAALPEPHARFYAASVVLALEALHSRHLVYRDLKPENLLIGEDGYLKMADFGFVKKVLPGARTNTLCGTPEYLAPEIISQEGHWQAADWWSLGVLIYELVAGVCPFYSEDRMEMYRQIVGASVKCPAHFTPELQDLVKRLLVRRPALRLGVQAGGADDIKRHPWFGSFDWEAFEGKKMKAPYVPKVSHPGDASNFKPVVDDDAAGGAYRSEPYRTTGDFSSF